jgi:hypothetical protein
MEILELYRMRVDFASGGSSKAGLDNEEKQRF